MGQRVSGCFFMDGEAMWPLRRVAALMCPRYTFSKKGLPFHRCFCYYSLCFTARVVKWHTRMLEVHVERSVGVRVPPRAPFCCRFVFWDEVVPLRRKRYFFTKLSWAVFVFRFGFCVLVLSLIRIFVLFLLKGSMASGCWKYRVESEKR